MATILIKYWLPKHVFFVFRQIFVMCNAVVMISVWCGSMYWCCKPVRYLYSHCVWYYEVAYSSLRYIHPSCLNDFYIKDGWYKSKEKKVVFLFAISVNIAGLLRDRLGSFLFIHQVSQSFYSLNQVLLAPSRWS